MIFLWLFLVKVKNKNNFNFSITTCHHEVIMQSLLSLLTVLTMRERWVVAAVLTLERAARVLIQHKTHTTFHTNTEQIQLNTNQNKLKHNHFINWFLELSDPPADYVYQLSKFNFTSIFKCFRLFEHENGPNWWLELMKPHMDCLCSLKCSKIMDWSQENHWSEARQSWESVR